MTCQDWLKHQLISGPKPCVWIWDMASQHNWSVGDIRQALRALEGKIVPGVPFPGQEVANTPTREIRFLRPPMYRLTREVTR